MCASVSAGRLGARLFARLALVRGAPKARLKRARSGVGGGVVGKFLGTAVHLSRDAHMPCDSVPESLVRVLLWGWVVRCCTFIALGFDRYNAVFLLGVDRSVAIILFPRVLILCLSCFVGVLLFRGGRAVFSCYTCVPAFVFLFLFLLLSVILRLYSVFSIYS